MEQPAPLCTQCRFFNGVNQRDLCLWHSSADPVRGVRSNPRPAEYERASWVIIPSKNRCKPEGRNFEPQPDRSLVPPPQRGK